METGAGEDHGASTVVTESTPTAYHYNENRHQAVQPVNIFENIKIAILKCLGFDMNSSSSVSVFTTQLISVTDTESTDSLKSAHAGREPPHKPVDPGHGPQHNAYADTRDV
ncbi:hypothetical protein MKW98_001204 [Papaver atlanticum]|uniref:Uncharacterized protein n=1 Tax=Papaver atlanticum TaxID=357466 RepID=A0AAD4XK98_9MAGN|nr:hypothetical protein MKW98_001204 [Papaver atlanticum]